MNLQQLYYFKTIAELEHYTKASQQLNISQSSLSHSITDLEKELGVSLFIRQGRNVKLTSCGAFSWTMSPAPWIFSTRAVPACKISSARKTG